jgi:DNA-binding transcriptional LysR family regulator
MNWRSVTFDWNQVRAFLVTVEEGSLSAAARALGSTQPTLGRQVAGLEEQLGVALFERVGKTLELTTSGIDLLDHVREMGEAAAKISLTAAGKSQAIAGRVCISAGDNIAAAHLPKFLKKLRAVAPLIDVEILAVNALSDLLRREADIAIRYVRPEQSELIAKRVGQESAHFYAAKEYLDTNGRPTTVAELRGHRLIGFGDDDGRIPELNVQGRLLRNKDFSLHSKSGIVAWEMAREGLGICFMLDQVANKYPEMERLDLGLDPVATPVWLVTHRELHTSRRIRLVFDLLANYLSEILV